MLWNADNPEEFIGLSCLIPFKLFTDYSPILLAPAYLNIKLVFFILFSPMFINK